MAGPNWADVAWYRRQVTVLHQAMSALLADLQAKGLLDQTLVVLATEFGRMPRINGSDERSHHDEMFAYLLPGPGSRAGADGDRFAAVPGQGAARPDAGGPVKSWKRKMRNRPRSVTTAPACPLSRCRREAVARTTVVACTGAAPAAVEAPACGTMAQDPAAFVVAGWSLMKTAPRLQRWKPFRPAPTIWNLTLTLTCRWTRVDAKARRERVRMLTADS